MKTTLKIEELAQFIFGIYLFSQIDYAWWWFPTLLLLPDLGIIGYAANARIGAITYNLFHSKTIAIGLILAGTFFLGDLYILMGVILFSHSSMDRIMGYGLKYPDSFNNTHLGKIGKQ